MPLTRSQKSDLIDDIAEQIEGADNVYLTDFEGLSVDETNTLRHRFREAGVDYRVVKNTLMTLALDRIDGLDELAEHLSGPTALAISEEPAAPARVIQDFTEEADTDVPALKAASIEGDLYPADALSQLAALKSRDELIADIVTLLQSPVKNVLGALQSQGQTLAGAIQSISEQEEG